MATPLQMNREASLELAKNRSEWRSSSVTFFKILVVDGAPSDSAWTIVNWISKLNRNERDQGGDKEIILLGR